ncbi:MAG: hypothetical protein C5S48_03610 [Candidatus Methanogaster sp.]|nr:MAG: hypothetical protein C5S48_03610 [ANME-2 cluster archaeon]
MDKNPYPDSEYFKLRKLRQKALRLSDWYKTRWNKLKESFMCMNTEIRRLECHRNKQLPRY